MFWPEARTLRLARASQGCLAFAVVHSREGGPKALARWPECSLKNRSGHFATTVVQLRHRVGSIWPRALHVGERVPSDGDQSAACERREEGDDKQSEAGTVTNPRGCYGVGRRLLPRGGSSAFSPSGAMVAPDHQNA